MRYGFSDTPDLSHDLRGLLIKGVSFDLEHTSFFLGRERLQVTDRPGMAAWREHLYVFLSRNAADPSEHFGLPRSRCIDIGVHVTI